MGVISARPMRETIFISGVNHRATPVAVRERLAYPEGEIVAALARLKQASPAIHEVALISTCNRVEIMGVTEAGDRAHHQATEFLAGDRGVDATAFRTSLYRHEAECRRAPSVPRRGEPRFDGGRRAANPRPTEERLCTGGGGRDCRPRAPSRVSQGVLGRQARAQGDLDRSRFGLGQARRRWGWRERSSIRSPTKR